MRGIEDRLGLTSAEQQLALAAVSKELMEPDFGTLEEDLRAQANDLSAAVHIERSQIIEACRLDLNFLAPMAMPDTFEEDFHTTNIAIFHCTIKLTLDSFNARNDLIFASNSNNRFIMLIKMTIFAIV